MEGVEILNQFTQAAPIVGLALALFTIAIVAFSLAVIVQYAYGASLTARVICSFLAILCLAGIIIFGNAVDHPENLKPQFRETFYQVTISEDVSVQEFFDKYEVVKQEGKIFTVKGKEK